MADSTIDDVLDRLDEVNLTLSDRVSKIEGRLDAIKWVAGSVVVVILFAIKLLSGQLDLHSSQVESVRTSLTNEIHRANDQRAAADTIIEARLLSAEKEILSGQNLSRTQASRQIHQVQENTEKVIQFVIPAEAASDSKGFTNWLRKSLGLGGGESKGEQSEATTTEDEI
jgi:hypothetical protein